MTAAEQQYRRALAARDLDGFDAIVDELFCSSWGDDALLAAGGTRTGAGRLRGGPAGVAGDQPAVVRSARPLDVVRTPQLDLGRQWSKVNARWDDRTTPPSWLAYPDTTLDLADVRARLVLASIREGDFDRAEFELDVFRRLHPQAAGRLGGEGWPVRRGARRAVEVGPRLAGRRKRRRLAHVRALADAQYRRTVARCD